MSQFWEYIDIVVIYTCYKLKNIIKDNYNRKMYSKLQHNSKVDFTEISASIPEICSFLSQAQRVNLSNANKFLRQFILSTNCWKKIEIYDAQYIGQKWKSFFDWVHKYIRIINPESLTISIFSPQVNEQSMLDLLMQGSIQSIEVLDIYFESDDVHLASSLCFPNLVDLTLRSKCASDQLTEFMFENLKKITALTIIKNDMNFTCKKLSEYSKNPLQKLQLKPYLLDFREVQKLTQKSSWTLKQLQIDVQQCQNETIVDIIAPLKKLQKLKIFHLQNLQTDDQLVKIVSKTDSLCELTATKAYNFQMTRVINSLKSPALLTLDLTDSRYLNDDDLITLCQNSPNLRNINISWCSSLTAHGLQILISTCLKLQNLNITGIKGAKDHIFKQYLPLLNQFSEQNYQKLKTKIKKQMQKQQPTKTKKHGEYIEDKIDIQTSIFNRKLDIDRQNIKSLRNLKLLDSRSCNGISDNILIVIYLINRKVKTYNYYGNCMALFLNDQENDFY